MFRVFSVFDSFNRPIFGNSLHLQNFPERQFSRLWRSLASIWDSCREGKNLKDHETMFFRHRPLRANIFKSDVRCRLYQYPGFSFFLSFYFKSKWMFNPQKGRFWSFWLTLALARYSWRVGKCKVGHFFSFWLTEFFEKSFSKIALFWNLLTVICLSNR